jgi:hypothetical protein
MAKRTPRALLITWHDLAEGGAFGKMEDFFKLKEKLKPEPFEFPEENEPAPQLLEEAQDSYERHLYYLKHLDHLIH